MRRAIYLVMISVVMMSVLQVTPAEARRSCRRQPQQCRRQSQQCCFIIHQLAATPNIDTVTCGPMKGEATVSGTVTVDTGTSVMGGKCKALKKSDPDPGLDYPSDGTPLTINSDNTYSAVTTVPDADFYMYVWIKWQVGMSSTGTNRTKMAHAQCQ